MKHPNLDSSPQPSPKRHSAVQHAGKPWGPIRPRDAVDVDTDYSSEGGSSPEPEAALPAALEVADSRP